jgi:hypothetical protein
VVHQHAQILVPADARQLHHVDPSGHDYSRAPDPLSPFGDSAAANAAAARGDYAGYVAERAYTEGMSAAGYSSTPDSMANYDAARRYGY